MTMTPGIRIEYMPLTILLLMRHDGNPKNHDLGELADSFARFGFTMPPAIDEASHVMIAGHGRCEALARLRNAGEPPPLGINSADGDWLVPVIRGLAFKNKDERDAYLVADNAHTMLGGWNLDALGNMLYALQPIGLEGIGMDQEQIDAILNPGEDDADDKGSDGTEVDVTGHTRVIGAHKVRPPAQMTNDDWELHLGDCLEGLKKLADNSVDAMVTDPPAGISFMGRAWDSDKGGRAQWIAWLASVMREALRVMKPGAHALVWALPRTSHWTATALDDAGFEIRDRASHLFLCVPSETEILTEHGWRKHSQIALGDRVVEIGDRGHASLTALQAINVYPFDGELCQIETRSTLQAMTPNHSVHAYACRAKWQRMEIDEQMTAHPAASIVDSDHPSVAAWRLPLGARGADPRGNLESVDIAELYGWVITEGGFHKDTPAVSIWQNEGDFANRIRDLLVRLAIPHSEYRRTRDDYDGTDRHHVQWYIRVGSWADRLIHDLAGDKPTPPEWMAWLPTDQASVLFETLVDGDGSRNSDQSGAWYQKRPEVRAWFQTLCFRLGYRSSENEGKSAIQWSKSDTTEIQRGVHRKRWASRVPYQGEVWCPTVASGRWVARYRGHVFITGNSGFPKSLDIAKELDKRAGHWRGRAGDVTIESQPSKGMEYERNDKGVAITPEAIAYEGYGTALKPALEDWWLVRKPLEGTVAENVLHWGTGGLNLDACRIGDDARHNPSASSIYSMGERPMDDGGSDAIGRWPAHLIVGDGITINDVETPALYFYCPKPARSETEAGLQDMPISSGGEATGRKDGSKGVENPRAGAGRGGGRANTHPTKKPIALMRWLVRLLAPPRARMIDGVIVETAPLVLDPFAGSGTTGLGALAEGCRFVGFERENNFHAIACARLRSFIDDPRDDDTPELPEEDAEASTG